MFSWLDGKKTYLVMAGGVLTAIGGLMSGTLDTASAVVLILNSLGFGAVKSAISKL